jgi:hypothetical protein
MGQKSEPSGFHQVYVLGLDDRGHPRGARFSVLRDSIVSAALDINCRALINQPEAVSALGMRLPVGTVCGSGKVVRLVVPNISDELYKALLDAVRVADIQANANAAAAISLTLH